MKFLVIFVVPSHPPKNKGGATHARKPGQSGAKEANLDGDLRLFIYRYFIGHGRSPSVAEMARGLSHPLEQVKGALERLSLTHAFVLQENGELWRAAPFFSVPPAFP